jgi:hypothetical protein
MDRIIPLWVKKGPCAIIDTGFEFQLLTMNYAALELCFD